MKNKKITTILGETIKYTLPSILVILIFFVSRSIYESFNTSTQLEQESPDSLINFDYLKERIKNANQLIKTGQIDVAIEFFKTILEYEKVFSKLHFHLAKAYCVKENNNEAAKHFKKSIDLEERNPNAHAFFGELLRKMGKLQESSKHLNIATRLAPKYFDAHLQLCKTYHDLDKMKESLKHGHIAAKLKPNNIFPYLNLAYTFNKMGDLNSAITMYKKVISMDPNCHNAIYNLGYSLKIQGKLKESLPYLTHAIELKDDYLDAHIARAQVNIALENFDEGWDEYEWRWGLFGIDSKKYRNEMWDGSDIKGKTILLRTEQGLGDTMQFVRLAKNVKELGAAKVICKVQKPLVKLLSRCPYIDKVVHDIKDVGTYDCYTHLMSLPRILKMQPDTIPAEIPYMYANPSLEKEWTKKLAKDKNFKVGICWHVDPIHEKTKSPWSLRSVELEQLAPLAKVKGITFYSLQKLDNPQQLVNIPEGMNLQTFGPDFDRKHGSFMDSAAIIKNLDLVITVDTCIAHLAGGLNTPVWMLLPFAPDCRWYLGRTDSPWYPTMTMFRQTKPNHWNKTIENIAVALGKEVQKKKVS